MPVVASTPRPGGGKTLPMAQMAANLRDFSRRGVLEIGQAMAGEIVFDLMTIAQRRNPVLSGRLKAATRPFAGNPRRGAGFGRRMPSPASPSAARELKYDLRRPFGIFNAASSPTGYPYSKQIWLGRGFRGGQMRGSKKLRRGAREFMEYAHARRSLQARRAIDRVKRNHPRWAA